MIFDKKGIVDLNSMNEAEARAFIQFLLSERRRHLADIEFIDERLKQTDKKFKLEMGW